MSARLGFSAELVLHEPLQRIQRLARLRAGRRDEDAAAGACRQHHQAHDRHAADRVSVFRDSHLSLVLADRLDEFRRRPGMQAALVDDVEFAGGMGGHVAYAYLPLRTRLATLIYLRPASDASTSALSMSFSPRTPASLMSIGRFTPAMTSVRPLSMTEIERLDGVPPNMSVRMMTPWP